MTYGSPFPPPPAEPSPSPGGPYVHPLSIGRDFELSWRMLRFHPRALFGAAALLLVPAYLVQAVMQGFTAPVVNDWALRWQRSLNEWQDRLARLRPDEPLPGLPQPPPFPAGFWEAVAIGILVGIGVALVSWLATAAVIHAAGRTYGGHKPSAREAVGEALRRAPSLIAAQLLLYLAILVVVLLGAVSAAVLIAQGAGLAGFLGVLVIVVAVVVLVVLVIRWAFVEQAIMLEGSNAVGAFGRSWRLVGGSALRVLGYIVVFGLLIGLLSLLVFSVIGAVLTGGQPPLDPLPIAAEVLLNGLLFLLVTPYSTIFFTLLYYDIRWRRGELAPAGASHPPLPHGLRPPTS